MTENIRTKAAESIEQTLDAGQSISQGDMSVSKASLRDAHAVLMQEDNREAARSGRRPIFRNFNLSGVR